ncbi:MAG: hypothetical protein KBE09_00650 [Candidatus Pacebacteria bacterium]|nr:hypothetical protein [Candidatus Paceibacterota bacterium]
MEWLRRHSTLFYALGVGLIILTGAVFISDKFATQADPSANVSWGTNEDRFLPDAGIISPRTGGGVAPAFDEENFFSHLANTRDKGASYVSLQDLGDPLKDKAPTVSGDGSMAFADESLIALLGSIESGGLIRVTEEGSKELGLADIYSLIPSNNSTPTTTKGRRSGLQLDLFDYGNATGVHILGQMETWGTRQNSILKRFIEDPTDGFKIREVEDLADSFVQLGKDIEETEPVPEPIKSAHAKVAAGYKAIGEHTRAVSQARSEAELINAMLASNAASDQFVKDYTSLADIFTAYNVSFSSTDSGRVFVFKAF